MKNDLTSMLPFIRSLIRVIAFCLPLNSIGQVFLHAQSDLPVEIGIDQVRQSVHRNSTSRYSPDRWTGLGVRIENPTDDARTVLSLIVDDLQGHRQFGRELWVPPRSIRTDWLPIQGATFPSPPSQAISLKTLLIDRERVSDGDVLLKNDSELIHGEILLPWADQGPSLGILGDANDGSAIDAVIALRLARGLSRRVVFLDETFYSAGESVLAGLDQLVLMSDRVQEDVLALSAIKHWLRTGGRLWIMLDQVDETTIACLLGESYEMQLIDRVPLIECIMKSRQPGTISPEGLPLKFDTPQMFHRCVLPQCEVLHTIDDWPASFFIRHEKGLVLFTALAGAAWVRPREKGDMTPTDPKGEVAWLAMPALDEVASRFSEQKMSPVLEPDDFRSYVSEQIGYRIVSRQTMTLILGLYCVSWMAAGIGFARRRRWEQSAWVGSILAIVATIGVIWLGNATRQTIPDTVAMGQWIEVDAEGQELEMNGLLGLYQRSETTQPLGADHGGVMEFDKFETTTKLERMIWTDEGEWHREPSTLPADLSFVACRSSIHADQRVSAVATFGAEGLEGQIFAGPLENLSDVVIAAPGGTGLAVTLNAEGKFKATSQSRISSGSYLNSSFLTDEQRRRQLIYQMALHQDSDYPQQPMCLVWADPLESGWRLPQDSKRRGSALVAMPLKFEPPVPGQSVTIPSQILTYESIGPAGAFDQKERRWGKLSHARQTILRFRLPREILPFQLERAELTVSIDAPGRPLEITDGNPDGSTILTRFDSPVGVVRSTFNDPDQLRLDDRGGLILGINVGDISATSVGLAAGSDKSFWQIGDVLLELHGKVVP